MKKILAFMLCISILCVFPTAFARDIGNSLQVLEALNIGSFSGEEMEVTRGEFVDALSDILNYSNRPQNTDGVFSDVTAASDMSGAIYNAFERGLISGYADGSFGIDTPILFEHAVKILVSALGYDNMAAVYGGYPAGYMIIADQNRMLRGVGKRSGDTLSGAECARLIENAMNTPIYQQVIFGSSEAVFEAYEGETMLSIYAKIKKIEGKVTDNGVTSLSGKSTTKAGNVIINSTIYDAGDTSAEDYLAYNIKAYVTCKGDENEKVLYIGEAETVNILAIPASRILCSNPGFSVQNIIYEDVYGNVQQSRVDVVADCIYNGNSYFDLTAEDLRLDSGKIILIDNTGDNIYDVIKVETSEIVIASGINPDRRIIYTKAGGNLSFEKSKNIKVYRDGTECDFAEISEWDVVSAGVSFDKSTVTLSVSSKKLSGYVDSISISDATVSVGGKYYNVTDSELIKKIELGASYEFCVDGDMNIAGIKSENQSNKYVGILAEAAQNNGVDSKLQVRIFSSLGNFDVFDIAQNASIDGKRDLTISAKETYILSNMKYQIVSCKKNDKGEIIEINLPYSGKPASYQSAEDLRVDYDGGEELYFCSPGNFDGKAVCDGGATVFLLPKNRSVFEDWEVVKGDSLIHNMKYYISAYSIGNENGFSEYIIQNLPDTPKFTSESYPVVVEKVSSKLNSSGEIVDMLRGYGHLGMVEYETREDGLIKSAGVKAGDIIRCVLNSNNQIISVLRMIDGENVKIVSAEESSFSGSRMYLYDVYSRYGTILGYTKTDLSKPFNEENVKSTLTLQLIASGTVVYEVDTKNNNKITEVDYNAILPYTSVGTERSRIFLYSHSASTRFIVIYK